MPNPEHFRRYQQLAAALKECRVEAGLRQGEIAERLGRPQSFVSKYESGERRLDLVELDQVCEALGLPLTQVVARFEERSA